jgi:hypothetical protein
MNCPQRRRCGGIVERWGLASPSSPTSTCFILKLLVGGNKYPVYVPSNSKIFFLYYLISMVFSIRATASAAKSLFNLILSRSFNSDSELVHA